MHARVTTLELDTGVTKDGVVVVSHERRISTLECTGPYVGQLIGHVASPCPLSARRVAWCRPIRAVPGALRMHER